MAELRARRTEDLARRLSAPDHAAAAADPAVAAAAAAALAGLGHEAEEEEDPASSVLLERAYEAAALALPLLGR